MRRPAFVYPLTIRASILLSAQAPVDCAAIPRSPSPLKAGASLMKRRKYRLPASKVAATSAIAYRLAVP